MRDLDWTKKGSTSFALNLVKSAVCEKGRFLVRTKKNQKLFVEKVSRLSLKTIDAKYQKEHFTHLMYPTKTAVLWSKTGVDSQKSVPVLYLY